MYIGLDVGGTFTDAVLIDDGKMIEKTKVETDSKKLLNSLFSALEPLFKAAKNKEIKRIVLSTTLITNLITTGEIEPAAIILIPGPGLNPKNYDFGVSNVYILSGAIDYRGREIEPLKINEIDECFEAIKTQGIKKVAIVGKFSQRNKAHETSIASFFLKNDPEMQIVMGHQVSGSLNFPRRVVTTYLTLATQDRFHAFYSQVLKFINAKGIKAPVYILKSDGGTLPLLDFKIKPVETIFSGPAASILGALVLTPQNQTSVVVDMGGTTTDLALILSGKPLLASRGAKVGGKLTHVRAFATESIALGGDSVLRVVNGSLEILPQRAGPAYCLGGPVPTPTDAMHVAGLTDIGDDQKARNGISLLARELNLNTEQAAKLILQTMVKKIAGKINDMFRAWENEPAYRVWELLQKQIIRPQTLVGIGGSAPSILPLLKREMNCSIIVPPYADVANAVGAALAKTTLRLTFRLDTENSIYSVEETGIQEKMSFDERFSLTDAEKFAFSYLKKVGKEIGIPTNEDPELVYSEVFNIVRGWKTTGRIYNVCVQFPPGVLINSIHL